MYRGSYGWSVVVLVAFGAAMPGQVTDYEAQVRQWRESQERDLRSDTGPLFVIGRYSLAEGRTEIGSDPGSGVVLPDRAPKRVGAIERQADRITFEPASSSSVMLNGKKVEGVIRLRPGPPFDAADKLQEGDFTLHVALKGDACDLLVRDRQSQFFREFHGLVWFPIEASYQVVATFTPYPERKTVRVPDTTGRDRQMIVPGYVTFRLRGEELRLEPVVSGDELFFMFKDRTAGRETYGAGRFLDAAMPKDGKVILDFNKAYSPTCASSPYTSCPIPPKQNSLAVRIEAGEKYAGGH